MTNKTWFLTLGRYMLAPASRQGKKHHTLVHFKREFAIGNWFNGWWTTENTKKKIIEGRERNKQSYRKQHAPYGLWDLRVRQDPQKWHLRLWRATALPFQILWRIQGDRFWSWIKLEIGPHGNFQVKGNSQVSLRGNRKKTEKSKIASLSPSFWYLCIALRGKF